MHEFVRDVINMSWMPGEFLVVKIWSRGLEVGGSQRHLKRRLILAPSLESEKLTTERPTARDRSSCQHVYSYCISEM
jgi:hypothetical protein